MESTQEELLQKGIYVDLLTPIQFLVNLAKKIRPVKTDFELVRVGGDGDGGYLLPDDLENIAACFSPGVDFTASFELDLLQKKGINSHLADYSVEGPPPEFQPRSFTKKFIGAVNSETDITLDTWVRSKTEFLTGRDLLLQMDIEGGEYVSLLGATEEVLTQFRVIVLEIHNVVSWGLPSFYVIVNAFFDKILEHFYVVHNHPNSACGLVNLGGFVAPKVFELTLLRKDRCEPKGYCDQLPHRLDMPNSAQTENIVLSEHWR